VCPLSRSRTGCDDPAGANVTAVTRRRPRLPDPRPRVSRSSDGRVRNPESDAPVLRTPGDGRQFPRRVNARIPREADRSRRQAGARSRAGARTSTCCSCFSNAITVGEPLDGRLADQRACGPRARPCRVGFWGAANSTEASRNLGDELVAQSWTSLFVQSAALRSSACASGCSSRRTPLFEFVQDLSARDVPADRLNATFSDVS
jgi:hypothetical protein